MTTDHPVYPPDFWPFSADDIAKIRAAYDVLTTVGNATAVDGSWDAFLDRAHHQLGLILAVDLARQCRTDDVVRILRRETSP